jgi:hypothetical protein
MGEWLHQFLSNSMVGGIGTLATIGFGLLSIYLYRRGKKRRGLTYKVHPVRTQIVKAGAVSRLSVLHDGHEIKTDITAAHIAIWNQGRESIHRADMLRPLIIETADQVPILEATIQMATHDVIGLKLDVSQCDQGRLGVSWEILEERDGGIVQMIYAGSPDLQITAQAISEGQRRIIDCSQLVPPVRPGVKERTVPRLILLMFASGLIVSFSEVFPFAGAPPPLGSIVLASLATVCLIVGTVMLLGLLRRVRPPFEF